MSALQSSLHRCRGQVIIKKVIHVKDICEKCSDEGKERINERDARLPERLEAYRQQYVYDRKFPETGRPINFERNIHTIWPHPEESYNGLSDFLGESAAAVPLVVYKKGGPVSRRMSRKGLKENMDLENRFQDRVTY